MGRRTNTAARGPAIGGSQCLSPRADRGFAAGVGNLEKVNMPAPGENRVVDQSEISGGVASISFL